jgi:hypothetical protein
MVTGSARHAPLSDPLKTTDPSSRQKGRPTETRLQISDSNIQGCSTPRHTVSRKVTSKRMWVGSHLISSRIVCALTRFKKLKNKVMRMPAKAKRTRPLVREKCFKANRVGIHGLLRGQLYFFFYLFYRLHCRHNWPCSRVTSRTYRNTFASDAVHDAEGRAKICKPCWPDLVKGFSELAFCNREEKRVSSYIIWGSDGQGSLVLWFKAPKEFTITVVINDLQHITGHEEIWSLRLITWHTFPVKLTVTSACSACTPEWQSSANLLCRSYLRIS